MRHVTAAILLSFVVVVHLLTAHTASGATDSSDIQVGFLHWGTSPRVIEHSWVQVPSTVRNRTEDVRTFYLTLRPEGTPGMVFGKAIAVGPAAQVDNQLLMTASRTREYEAMLRDEDSLLLARQEVRSEFQGTYQKHCLFFINDNLDIMGLSDVKKMEGLIDNLAITRSTAQKAPSHWQEFGGSSIVVIVDPTYADMSALQFKAIKDFVSGGGTLLFLSPVGAERASATLLQDMLPVLPLHVRQVDRLPALERWAYAIPPQEADPRLTWNDGMSFLESVPAENSIVTISEGPYPLAVWKRFGLGRTGVLTFDPFKAGFRDHPVAGTVWNHLLAYATHPPLTENALHTAPLKDAVKRLAGFRVPDAAVIRTLLLGYGLALVIVFILGALTHKHVVAWVANGLIAFGLTVGIFTAAYRQVADRPEKNINTLDLKFSDATTTVGEKVATFFSKVDARPLVRGTDGSVLFRAPPPSPSPIPTQYAPPIMEIWREQGRSVIPRLSVHALKQISVSASYRSETATPLSFPVIEKSANRPRLQDYALPDGIPATAKAYLCLGNGFVRVAIENGICRTDYSPRGALELDTLTTDYEHFLRHNLLPVPCLVFMYRQRGPSTQFTVSPGDYNELQHCIQAIPVNTVTASGKILLIPEELPLRPTTKNARALYWLNRWREISLHGGSTVYEFAAELPPYAQGLELERITAELEIYNPTGKITSNLALLPVTDSILAEQSNMDRPAVPFTSRQGSVFEFNDLGSQPVLDKRMNWVRLRLTVSAETKEEPSAFDVQTWRINRFRITAEGSLPESDHPMRF
ncbi:MAG: hypothetical protein K9N51_10065 [Candidatus Pacebacteria bacterium]|nr:hypothetical protein [Candidatus Paceibacterota bacterium]